MKAATLKKQALERWSHVPRDEQKKLLEELEAWPRGQAVIELGELISAPWPEYGSRCKAQVIPILSAGKKDYRYLMLSEIPKPIIEPDVPKEPA